MPTAAFSPWGEDNGDRIRVTARGHTVIEAADGERGVEVLAFKRLILPEPLSLCAQIFYSKTHSGNAAISPAAYN